MNRVLVLGGYGGFGGRVAILLAEAGYSVTVAGRDRAKAEAFCAKHAALPLHPLALDRSGDLGQALVADTPWLVVDAAGPFQQSDYRVAEACIAARCHYFDLADARAFVCGIARLDTAARAAGVAVISGVSSVPALSAAVTDSLSTGLDRTSEIDIALSASNRAAGGVSVTRAILSYVGKPIHLWRGQAWRDGYGWQEMGEVRFAVTDKQRLRRRVALCDVPDLDLLPERCPGRPAVRFRAGAELEIQNLALWLLSWPVRWGWLRDLRGLTAIGVWLQKALSRIDGNRSAMRVVVNGWSGETAIRRTWTLMADRGDGPWIPALATPLLAARLRNGLGPGASSAAGLLTREAFETAFAPFAIATEMKQTAPEPLFGRVMGARFAQLPAVVRAMHLVNGDLGAHGMAEIARGTSLVSKVIGRMFRFPRGGSDIPVSVWMREEGGEETWHRVFGGSGFSSSLSQRGSLIVERFGLLRFAMELVPSAEGLSMPFRRWWVGPVPLPRFLLPRGIAREYEADGRFHFDVPITLPLIGPVIHYRGWLIPPAAGSALPAGPLNPRSPRA